MTTLSLPIANIVKQIQESWRATSQPLRDRSPQPVPEPDPPAYIEWGGPSRITMVKDGVEDTSWLARGFGVSVDANAGRDAPDDPAPADPDEPPGQSIIELTEIAAATYEKTVTGSDGCSITVEKYSTIIFDVSPIPGLPHGVLVRLNLKQR